MATVYCKPSLRASYRPISNAEIPHQSAANIIGDQLVIVHDLHMPLCRCWRIEVDDSWNVNAYTVEEKVMIDVDDDELKLKDAGA